MINLLSVLIIPVSHSSGGAPMPKAIALYLMVSILLSILTPLGIWLYGRASKRDMVDAAFGWSIGILITSLVGLLLWGIIGILCS